MEIAFAILVTAIIVIAIMSKLSSGLRYEEQCAEEIQNAYLKKGTPIELGMARLMLRNAVDLINHLNESNESPTFLPLRRVRQMALNGILHSLKTGIEPQESVSMLYKNSRN